MRSLTSMAGLTFGFSLLGILSSSPSARGFSCSRRQTTFRGQSQVWSSWLRKKWRFREIILLCLVATYFVMEQNCERQWMARSGNETIVFFKRHLVGPTPVQILQVAQLFLLLQTWQWSSPNNKLGCLTISKIINQNNLT